MANLRISIRSSPLDDDAVEAIMKDAVNRTLFDMTDQTERERYKNRRKDVTLLGEKETEVFFGRRDCIYVRSESTQTSAIGNPHLGPLLRENPRYVAPG
jgi:hypothetical protein